MPYTHTHPSIHTLICSQNLCVAIMKLMTFHNIIWVVLNVLHTLDVVVVLSDTYAITLFSLNSFFCLLEHLDLVFTWVSSMCKLTRERERGGGRKRKKKRKKWKEKDDSLNATVSEMPNSRARVTDLQFCSLQSNICIVGTSASAWQASSDGETPPAWTRPTHPLLQGTRRLR